MAKQLQKWKPTDEDIHLVYKLTELGWTPANICVKFKIRQEQFALALEDNSGLKAFIENAEQIRKDLGITRMEWRPDPRDLDLIAEYAATGLTPSAIAAKLRVPRAAFKARLEDTPQLTDAYEQGQGLYQCQLIEQADTLLSGESQTLKYVASMLIFKLKAHCGFSDRPDLMPAPPTQKLEVSGKVDHKHSLNAPDKVPAKDFAEFAQAEMNRANTINAEKLKVIEIKAKADDD